MKKKTLSTCGITLILTGITLIGSAVAAPPQEPTVDPDLEPGFPVQTILYGGSYQSGPSIHTLVGNIDATPDLEILVSGIAAGPLYAFKSDGSPANGWPVSTVLGVAYPALGRFSGTPGLLEVFSAWNRDTLAAYTGNGNLLPEWPLTVFNYLTMPPTLADFDGDGRDEAFVCQEDYILHMYRVDGTSTAMGYTGEGGQHCNTPAVADIDGDGDNEVIYTSGDNSLGTTLGATHHTGYRVDGFPILIPEAPHITLPVVGDVDGDGAMEIIVIGTESNYPWRAKTYIYRADGTLKLTAIGTGSPQFVAPALADLDGDRIPEIIYQTKGGMEVVRGDGTPLPGWPVIWGTPSEHLVGNSAPVIGDINGDWRPDIVITTELLGDAQDRGEVRAYDPDGRLLPGFPKVLKIGSGAVPAIADIDLDGRNELIVTGSYLTSVAGYYDKVWVYDLGGPAHGPVHWGQLNGGPDHRGVYTLHAAGETGTPPTAIAGEDQVVAARQLVTLDGGQSYDTDGAIMHAAWKQLSGEPVEIANADTLTATFTSPGLKGSGTVTLEFELTVTDNDGATRRDQVSITVSKL